MSVNPAIWAKVQDAFAEALGLDLDEVQPDSKIIEDLGAESLDFLDIVFRLERAFDIKIPRGGIEQAAQDGVEYEVNGVLTPAAIERLQALMPEVPDDEFHEGLRSTEIPELFRVHTFYNIVERLLDEKNSAAAK